MISKNEVKYIQSLFQKKNRDQEGVFVAEGIKLVDELLLSVFKIRKIYATREWLNRHTDLPNVAEVEAYELEKISSLHTPNQVVAVVEKQKIAGEPEQQHSIILALDGIQDPGNLGTIIRIADWFGITQIVAGAETADVYNPKTVQATMGSITRVKIWNKDIAVWLADVTVPVYGAMLDGENIYGMPRISEGVIVIGNESKGIRQNVLPLIQQPVTIPAKGKAESLNAAVATGIILSHLVQ